MNKSLLILGAFLLIIRLTHGQDTLAITKTEFIEMVSLNNYEGKKADKQAEMAYADYQQSRALYLPIISASYTATTTTNPLMAFGSKLNQAIVSQEDFNPAILNDPGNVGNYATEISVLQPLLNLDGVYQRNAAKIQKEAYKLKALRTKEYLTLEASKLYMQLQLGYQALNVLERAQRTASEAFEMVTDYYDEGLVQKADVLDAQVHQNEVQNQLQYAISNVQNTSDLLLTMMGEEPTSTTLKPEIDLYLMDDAVQYSESLPENRKDLLAMSMSVEGSESMLRSTKMQLLPRINAFGSFQVYDQKLLGFGASGYLLGAQLSWNIFDGYTTLAKKNKARLEMEKAQIEQKDYFNQQQSELSKTNRMLRDAKNKVRLSQLTFEQASEAYKIRKDRFEQGLEKTVDLLAAESQMYQKELQLQQAIFEHNFSQDYMRFLTNE
ncbi:MAG: TolC family protein [Cyclobacteriaceae bacterium]